MAKRRKKGKHRGKNTGGFLVDIQPKPGGGQTVTHRTMTAEDFDRMTPEQLERFQSQEPVSNENVEAYLNAREADPLKHDRDFLRKHAHVDGNFGQGTFRHSDHSQTFAKRAPITPPDMTVMTEEQIANTPDSVPRRLLVPWSVARRMVERAPYSDMPNDQYKYLGIIMEQCTAFQQELEAQAEEYAARSPAEEMPLTWEYMHDLWSLVCASEIAIGPHRTVTLLVKAADGNLPPQHDLPRDPYSRYIDYLGLQEARARADALFTVPELHTMFEVHHGQGAQANDAFSTEAFIKCGCNTFVVSRYLQDLFQVEDLKVHTEDLPAPPFEGMWFQIPYSGIEFVSAKTGNLVEADGFYVADYQHPDIGHCILVNLWAAEEPAAACHGHDATLGCRIENPFTGVSARVENPFREEVSVERTVERIEADLAARTHIEHRELHAKALADAFRIYFHVLLYLRADYAIAKDIYASELKRVRDILESRRKNGRKATRRDRRDAEKELKALPKSRVHLLAPALVAGMPFSKKRMKPKTLADGTVQKWVPRHRQRYISGPRNIPNPKRVWKYKAGYYSPRLEGDPPFELLLRSKEFILE